MKVLIVDDIEEIRSLLEDKLKARAIDVVQCESGNKAIELLESGQEFDLIISDYQMADGDGLELLKYVSENHLKAKFAFYTSSWTLRIPYKYEHFLGVFFKDESKKLFEQVDKIKESLKVTGWN